MHKLSLSERGWGARDTAITGLTPSGGAQEEAARRKREEEARDSLADMLRNQQAAKAAQEQGARALEPRDAVEQREADREALAGQRARALALVPRVTPPSASGFDFPSLPSVSGAARPPGRIGSANTLVAEVRKVAGTWQQRRVATGPAPEDISRTQFRFRQGMYYQGMQLLDARPAAQGPARGTVVAMAERSIPLDFKSAALDPEIPSQGRSYAEFELGHVGAMRFSARPAAAPRRSVCCFEQFLLQLFGASMAHEDGGGRHGGHGGGLAAVPLGR